MEIETNRLRIRSFTVDDISTYASIVSDSEVTKYLGATGAAHPYAEAEAYIIDVISRDTRSGISRYAVRRIIEQDLIGFCGFKGFANYIDFGWRYAKHAWGNGYATEAALAVRDHGIEQLRLTGIVASAFVENTASIRIIEKLGFERVEHIEIQNRKAVRYHQS